MLRLTSTAVLGALAVLLGGHASAAIHLFDFESGVSEPADTPQVGLTNYLQVELGRTNVSANGNANWLGASTDFGGSDAVQWSGSGRATLDFDTASSGSSGYKLTAISFDSASRETRGVDFRLDVFDDATNSWVNNFYTIDNGSQPSVSTPVESLGLNLTASGLLVFPSAYEVTRIRFNDPGNPTYLAQLDNLVIYDNVAPEPLSLLTWAGLGAMGCVVRRARSAA